MPIESKGWVRPRPLRVAFLIEDGELAHLTLDGIIADCYNRWGGRFSLIVPCTKGRIPSGYWPWLEAYDPDIVYSYVPLSRTDVLEVYERLSPSQYKFHHLDASEPELTAFRAKPIYDFEPVSSLSVIFKLARYRPVVGPNAPLKIIDSWHTEKPTRFLTDNFGTYSRSRGGSIYPADATGAASLLTIVSPEYLKERRYGVPPALDVISSETDAFKEFVHHKATSLSLLSILLATKLDVRSGNWSSSFNLVVGDSLSDRLLFWNARLLVPDWLDNDLCCLRVEKDQLNNQEFLAVLGDLLKYRNHVNSGSGGQSQLTVRSASLSNDELTAAHKLIISTKPWSSARLEVVSNLDALIPKTSVLQEAREGNRFGPSMLQRPDWSEFTWLPPIARPPVAVPDHFSDAPIRQFFTQGYWCTDFILEHGDPGPHLTLANRWMLPRRWRMAGAFKANFLPTPRLLAPLRRSRDGNLAIFVCADHPIDTIEIPTAYEAMHYALAQDGSWDRPDSLEGDAYPPNKVAWCEPSNEARYLTGVLGMTGGLRRATQILLHPFLRDIFATLGGTPNLPSNKIEPTVNRLIKRTRSEPKFDLKSDTDRLALADLIVKAARTLKTPMQYFRFEDLKLRWKAHREAYWSAHGHVEGDPAVDWDREEEQSLEYALMELRRAQILFQGHRWTCRKCHHKNWVDLGALSSLLLCEVCKQSTQTPVSLQWLFRANEFLIESLRDHSALSLVWALSALSKRARHSFVYVEPTWFGFSSDSGSNDPDAEADLLVVLDGKAFLCEVKSSWHSYRPSHLTDLIWLATRIRPDVVVLAVMDAAPGPEADLSAATAQLGAAGIKFELLTEDAHREADSPYLSFDNSKLD